MSKESCCDETLPSRLVAAGAVLLTACGAPSDERLVGRWKFDEAAADRAPDSSGAGNAGTVRNGQWGEGVAQGALLLDGSGDSVVIVPCPKR